MLISTDLSRNLGQMSLDSIYSQIPQTRLFSYLLNFLCILNFFINFGMPVDMCHSKRMHFMARKKSLQMLSKKIFLSIFSIFKTLIFGSSIKSKFCFRKWIIIFLSTQFENLGISFFCSSKMTFAINT